ncbi:nitroreductase family deazaflavin-dependent oxidoreductase [Rudaeicoccus suwonensis]|uniref:nitroreductase family deazaflavin-dependent oxidoreductase n=1 Tax=Rudaeicoccus suwonensis TaxID=657409 RepID=UPI0011A9B8B0|nr:nitroreductase family deazaflavin-dependent oxidoreductase [Rudaeicoccus suwonensis]
MGSNVGAVVGGRLLTTRWLVRSPLPLYRHGFGWILGSRFLMLEHRGRVSGEPRHVVLECVQRLDTTTIFVASGFGSSAQWYRNIVADPAVRVSIGTLRDVPGVAVPLDAPESARVLGEYAQRHPTAMDQMTDMVRAARPDQEVDIRVVRLDLAGRSTNSDAGGSAD